MRWLRRLAFSLGLLLVMSAVWAAPQQQTTLFQLFQLNLRTDLELLANVVFGEETRPDTWTGTIDLETPRFSADLWFDNEQVADRIFGVGTRPDNWIGATTPNAQILAQNVRHDLEISADQRLGLGIRPDGWNGAPPRLRCSRSLQNLLRLLEDFYSIVPNTPDSVVDYCGVVKLEVEDRVFNTGLVGDQSDAVALELLSGVRGDLERLADERSGLDIRPAGWVGNRDAETEGFVTQLGEDLELLADDALGVGVRPEGWVGVVTTSLAVTNRNLRFDLETLTDLLLGEGLRPTGWQGVDPLASCETTLQNLIIVVNENIMPVGLPSAENFSARAAYCAEAARVTNDLAENPPVIEEEEGEAAAVDTRFIGQSRNAFVYLDPAALDYMGIMPWDTEFRAWYRNFNESTMMFVSGVDFAVYIDLRWTTLPQSAFDGLPSLEGVRPLAFCDAAWCNGPGPTPTPTGVGPIAALLDEATPPSTRDATQIADQGKIKVSWNNIRVGYLLDRPEAGTVQVTLEICADPSLIACEPATSVFNNSTGVFEPVVQTFGGLNVYELPYGYLTNLVIEGDTRFASEVWISDPTLRG